MSKKAQVAMEFIMTYGWAILLVLTAIGALAYFGVFNFQDQIPETCFFSSQFPCTEWLGYVHPTDPSVAYVSFWLTNSFPGAVVVSADQMYATFLDRTSGTKGQVFCNPNDAVVSFWTGTPYIWQQERRVKFVCGSLSFSGPVRIKDRMKVNIYFNYSRTTGTYDKVMTGELSLVMINGSQFYP